MFSDQLPVCRPQFGLLDKDFTPGGELPGSSRGRAAGGAGAPAERPPSRAGSDSPFSTQLDRRRPNTTAGRFATARWGQPSHNISTNLWPSAGGGAFPEPPRQRRPMTSAGAASARDFDPNKAATTLITMSVLPTISLAE